MKTRKIDNGTKTRKLDDGTKTHRGKMGNTAEKGGCSDLRKPRAQVKETGPLSRRCTKTITDSAGHAVRATLTSVQHCS